MIGLREAMMVVGIGAGGAMASAILEEFGKPRLAQAVNIIVYIASGVVALAVWKKGLEYVEDVFHITI